MVRSGDLDAVAAVEFQTSDATAKAGEDYTPATGALTFGIGQASQTLRIAILNDGLREQPATETFLVTLASPSPNAVLGARAGATVTIEDNDPGFQVEFAAYRAQEDSGSVVVAITRGPDENSAASVQYATAAQTATAGSDYAEASGALSFAAEEKLKLVPILILNDGLSEPEERFRLTITNAVGNALGTRTSATITVIDNDSGVEFLNNQVWVHEDRAGVGLKVVRGNDRLLQPFAVNYTVADLSATAGEDHLAASGGLEFAAGETSKELWIPVVNDALLEPDEKFRLQLSNPTGGIALGRSSNLACTVTICDATGLQTRRFRGIDLSGDRANLGLAGGVPKRFLPFYSIFQLEASADLAQWQALKLFGYPNQSVELPVFNDVPTVQMPRRFYRMPATPLVTPSVPPSGPHSVGITRRQITDLSRRNRYDISTNSSFMISIWYPAEPRPGQRPDAYEEQPLATSLQWQTAAWMDRAPLFSSYSFLDAPPRLSAGGYPVVLHSHGLGSARYENMERAEHLASHGYVVVTVSHSDAGAEVFPDGSLFLRPQAPAATAAGFKDRVLDMIRTADELERINRGDELLAGVLDLERVAATGFSWGCHTAAEFCRVDPRGKVVVSLDWGSATDFTAPDLLRLGTQKPCLMLNASGNLSQVLFDHATRDAYWIQISNTEHLSFHGYDWFTFPNSASAREATRTITAYTLSFLNKYLQNRDDGLLNGPSSAYPRATVFKRKP